MFLDIGVCIVRQTGNTAAVRKLSGLVFGGAEHRVEIAAEIAERDLIANTTELADALKLKAQTVNHELRRLETAGLLQRTEPQGQKVFFVGAQSDFWRFCQELRANAVERLESVPRY
jgi:predicted transcriptional regulator